MLILIGCMGCNPAGDKKQTPGDNPAPLIESISPTSKVHPFSTFELTVLGSNFVSGSRIVFNGREKTTLFFENTLTCRVEQSDIPLLSKISKKSAEDKKKSVIEIPVFVRTPPAGGGESETLYFKVYVYSLPGKIKNISNTGHYSSCPGISVDAAGNIYVVWEESQSLNHEIYFTRSSDSGSHWDSPVNISNDAGEAGSPSVSSSGNGNVYVVWSYSAEPGSLWKNDIHFIRSTDGGATWATRKILSYEKSARSPVITTDSKGNIYVVWSRWLYGWESRHIHFRSSFDKGETWGPEKVIADQRVNLSPAVAADNPGDNLYVTWVYFDDAYYYWRTGDMLLSLSRNSGAEWSTPANFIDTVQEGAGPDIAADGGGNVYSVWSYAPGNYRSTDVGKFKICWSRDYGSSWNEAKSFTQGTGNSSPKIALAPGGQVCLVWHHSPTDCDEDGSGQIHFSRSDNYGQSWSTTKIITNTPGNFTPAIATDRQVTAYIVWQYFHNWYQAPPPEILFTKIEKQNP